MPSRWALSWRSPARRRRKWSTNRKAAFRLDPTALNFVAIDNSAGASSGDLYIGELSFALPQPRLPDRPERNADRGRTRTARKPRPSSSASSTSATFNVASGPAVDGSAGANAGRIYVPDVFNGVVDLFDEAGEYVCQITGAATPSASECAGATGSETPSGGIEPLSVAVDPASGKVAVGDGSGVVYEFNEAGEYTGEIADPHIFSPISLAFDSAGNLYLVNGNRCWPSKAAP